MLFGDSSNTIKENGKEQSNMVQYLLCLNDNSYIGTGACPPWKPIWTDIYFSGFWDHSIFSVHSDIHPWGYKNIEENQSENDLVSIALFMFNKDLCKDQGAYWTMKWEYPMN